MSVRSTAKAIILNNGKILLNKCYDKNNGEYYSLPGGGQNKYETLHEAIIRECLEETGYKVKPVCFAALCEEICDNLIVRQTSQYPHKMFHIFICELCSEERTTPTEIDKMQIDTQWLDIKDLNNIKLLPKAVGDNILKLINKECDVFLGSEHIEFNHG